MKHLFLALVLISLPSVTSAASGQVVIPSTQYVSVASSSAAAEIVEQGHYVVSSNEVHLLAAPRANAIIQLTLHKGDHLNLMGVQDDVWAKVKLQSGRIGYLYTSSIQSLASIGEKVKEQDAQSIRLNLRQQRAAGISMSKTSSSSVSSQSSVTSPWISIVEPKLSGDLYHVTSPNLNLRMDARATAFLLHVLHKGDTVAVVQHLANGWAKVTTIDNVTGYVFASFLAK